MSQQICYHPPVVERGAKLSQDERAAVLSKNEKDSGEKTGRGSSIVRSDSSLKREGDTCRSREAHHPSTPGSDTSTVSIDGSFQERGPPHLGDTSNA